MRPVYVYDKSVKKFSFKPEERKSLEISKRRTV